MTRSPESSQLQIQNNQGALRLGQVSFQEEIRRMIEQQTTQFKTEIFERMNHIDARLNFIEQNTIIENKTIQFQGKEWILLFGVNSEDVHDYDSTFWTSEDLIFPSSKKISYKTTFKFVEFSKKPIKHLYIKAENGRYSELELPETLPLRDFFARSQVTNLVWKSGARDPLELITHRPIRNISKPEWRINSCPTPPCRSFKIRLGGYSFDNWPENYGGLDSLGQPCSAEGAGFGITGEQYSLNVQWKKSFGVRYPYDYPGQYEEGQITMGAVVYGRQ
ncbi:hypothetical protein FGO68_gene13723 [Halteria grandinella]|uniref:Uncharacterized protein n=1 Tax=Halteria grandinella TaxID=5974 RepID=A0A8J8NTJ7_HALGN|nr:hypothetical protein FGO68_gene13723 [Halteria grandinella]